MRADGLQGLQPSQQGSDSEAPKTDLDLARAKAAFKARERRAASATRELQASRELSLEERSAPARVALGAAPAQGASFPSLSRHLDAGRADDLDSSEVSAQSNDCTENVNIEYYR